jgi:hypothetical protein
MPYDDDNVVLLFRPRSKTMTTKRVIHVGTTNLAWAVDTLRDLLVAVAAHRISTQPRCNHVLWREPDGSTSKLTCRRLAVVLKELDIEFHQCGVPMRTPPLRVLSMLLNLAPTMGWFAPGECGEWNRAHNPWSRS